MDVWTTADDLAALMARQLRVRGTELSEVAHKAGRKLPRHLHTEVQAVLDACLQAEHPKFAHRIDQKRLKKAVARLEKFLAKQNPKAERRREILDRIAAVAFVVFVVVLGVFFFLLSRGAFER